MFSFITLAFWPNFKWREEGTYFDSELFGLVSPRIFFLGPVDLLIFAVAEIIVFLRGC